MKTSKTTNTSTNINYQVTINYGYQKEVYFSISEKKNTTQKHFWTPKHESLTQRIFIVFILSIALVSDPRICAVTDDTGGIIYASF